MKILAIDLGKMKSVACDYESETARTEPAILEDLFRRHQPDGVVIDVGPAAGWVTDLAARMKIELQVANPSHQAWRWRGVKNKTDRVDAVKLAQLSTIRIGSRTVGKWAPTPVWLRACSSRGRWTEREASPAQAIDICDPSWWKSVGWGVCVQNKNTSSSCLRAFVVNSFLFLQARSSDADARGTDPSGFLSLRTRYPLALSPQSLILQPCTNTAASWAGLSTSRNGSTRVSSARSR